MLAMLYIGTFAGAFLILGLFMIHIAVSYMDCDRTAGTVNCVITTRLLGIFATGRYTAQGATRAQEVKECEGK